MKRWAKRVLLGLGVLLVAGLVGAGWYLTKALPIGTVEKRYRTPLDS